MTPNPITIKYLQNVIKTVSDAHPQIKSFVVGEQYDFDENVSAFPCVWTVANAFNPNPGSKVSEISFMLTVLDRVDDGLQGETDVLSGCATMLTDIFNTIEFSLRKGGSHEGEKWRVTKLEGRQKIVDNVSNHVACGYMCEIFFEVPFNMGTCNQPA